jgi:hypothetical protein
MFVLDGKEQTQNIGLVRHLLSFVFEPRFFLKAPLEILGVDLALH